MTDSGTFFWPRSSTQNLTARSGHCAVRGLGQAEVDTLTPILDRLGPRLNAYISYLKRRANSLGGKGVSEEISTYEVVPGGDYCEETFEQNSLINSESTNQQINESTL